jgi:5S rRNA maturation endonuclease (ribonuclease M5)
MIDILQLIQTEAGLTFRKKTNSKGGEYCSPCPFCGGTDRFLVWPNAEKPNYWCRQCEKKGDAIQFLRDYKKLSFAEASEYVGKIPDKAKDKKVEKKDKPHTKREIVKTTNWQIKNIDGEIEATHIRLDYADGGKDYPWEVNGKKGLQGKNTANLPLFGMEHFNSWPDEDDIIICEGEKAANALIEAGFHALGTVCGAQSCPNEIVFNHFMLRKCNVILWPDNDAPGQKHMDAIGAVLQGMGIVPYFIHWDSAKPKEDAYDYLKQGMDVIELVDQAKLHRTAPYYPPIYVFDEAYNMMMDAIDGKKRDDCFPTGFAMVDSILDGYAPWLTVLCSRPGMGKTAYALQSIVKGATKEKKGIIVSLETQATVIYNRLVAYECGYSVRTARTAADSLSDVGKRELKNKVAKSYTHVSEYPILIRDKQGMSPDDLRRDLEMLMSRENIGIIMIDHMGKMKGQGKNSYERASYVSKELSSIALEYRVPILALCQLNRETERFDRKDKRPQLSDLRSSGEIEEDARVVLGLYRDDYYSESEIPVQGLFQVMLLKNNEGESRLTIPLERDEMSWALHEWPEHRKPEFDAYLKGKGWIQKSKQGKQL